MAPPLSPGSYQCMEAHDPAYALFTAACMFECRPHPMFGALVEYPNRHFAVWAVVPTKAHAAKSAATKAVTAGLAIAQTQLSRH